MSTCEVIIMFYRYHPQFVQLEAIISAIIDEYPRLRSHKSLFTFASCLLMFLGSILFTTQVNLDQFPDNYNNQSFLKTRSININSNSNSNISGWNVFATIT